MKINFSKSWKSSKQPRKQKKFAFNAPLHTVKKRMSTHLSKDLIKKYNKRNIPIRKGDKVKIMRGQFKGKTGEITKVNLKLSKVHVDTAFILKRDGTKAIYPVSPSNLLITELKLEDKKRKQMLERGVKKK